MAFVWAIKTDKFQIFGEKHFFQKLDGSILIFITVFFNQFLTEKPIFDEKSKINSQQQMVALLSS